MPRQFKGDFIKAALYISSLVALSLRTQLNLELLSARKRGEIAAGVTSPNYKGPAEASTWHYTMPSKEQRNDGGK